MPSMLSYGVQRGRVSGQGLRLFRQLRFVQEVRNRCGRRPFCPSITIETPLFTAFSSLPCAVAVRRRRLLAYPRGGVLVSRLHAIPSSTLLGVPFLPAVRNPCAVSILFVRLTPRLAIGDPS